MHALATMFYDTLRGSLTRASVTTCSKWAEQYRVMGKPFPGPWKWDHHPWLKEMHDCTAEEMIGQKSAQMGFTECALNKTFFAIDVERNSVLYLLPASKPDAKDFACSRFDPALELSDHLSKLFTDTQNVGHKRAGSANLFIRGSKSRSQVKSIPVAVIIADEVDEMDQDNLKLARERTAGQMEKQIVYISTPTINNKGINYYFRSSTQSSFFFRCPHCSKLIDLTFPDSLVITAEVETDLKILDSYLICKECKLPLDHKAKKEWLRDGIWVPKHPDYSAKGYHVSQLYSMTVKPSELARHFRRAERDQAEEQEFYNSKLGLTHEVDGARIKDEHFEATVGGYNSYAASGNGKVVTMGVDVGKWLHIEIAEWTFMQNAPTRDVNLMAEPRILLATKTTNFLDLDRFMRDFNVTFCVIDMQPETRLALEFAQRWHRVRLCHYDYSISSKQIVEHAEEYRVNCNRTSWLDLSLGRIKGKHIRFPMDLCEEYKTHLKAPVRIYKKDRYNNPIALYVTGESEQDHYAHARNYSEIALPLAVSCLKSENINDVWD